MLHRSIQSVTLIDIYLDVNNFKQGKQLSLNSGRKKVEKVTHKLGCDAFEIGRIYSSRINVNLRGCDSFISLRGVNYSPG